MSDVDYVIVGGGSAGCMLAARLTEDPDRRVLLIEAGAEDSSPLIKDPTVWPTIQQTADDWAFSTVTNAATGHVHDFPRGRVLGGSGSINAMMYLRGAPGDYDRWAAMGATGWSFADLLPYFRRMETAAGDPTYRGTEGPLRPGPAAVPHPLSLAFVEAAQQAGLPHNEDFNAGELPGAGLIDLLIHDGQRDSTANHLNAIRASRPNLTVWTDTSVRRLVIEDGRCRGVEVTRDGTTVVVEATEEVIVSCGTIGSPTLLMLSGIGPAGDLESLGIDVVRDLPGVGQNLQDHPLVNVAWESTQDVVPGSNNLAEAVAYLSTSVDREDDPDIQIVFIHVPFHNPWQSISESCYTMGVSLMRPAGRGTVRLASADPDTHPLIDVDYLGREEDVLALLEGVEQALEIGGADALAPWRGREVLPGAPHDRETLRQFLREGVRTYTHIVGTCRMGTGDDAVVDPELRVHGIDGLRVVDASVMPTVVSANTNPATIMIAEKATDLIKAAAGASAGAEKAGGMA